jgi:signal transduction histidine kinase
MVLAAVTLTAAIFYFSTVGVIDRNVDAQLQQTSQKLADIDVRAGEGALSRRIAQLLDDGIDQDTEGYLLLDRTGRRLAGNLKLSPASSWTRGGIVDLDLLRNDRLSRSRILPRRLPGGAWLIVGRDLKDVADIDRLVVNALTVGTLAALALAVAAAVIFRNELEHRVADIRRVAREIESGDLSLRIPVGAGEDEFARLGRDINRMLDRIQRLMEGVRDVSNAIAHDLRTPLGRIRGTLEEALEPGIAGWRHRETIHKGIEEIDTLIDVFDKLLRISEAESGALRASFEIVDLHVLTTDVAEFYDALAEANGMVITTRAQGKGLVLGDRGLLLSALSNLVDNAIKYAGPGGWISIAIAQTANQVVLSVADNGAGIAADERDKVITRFYRLDQSRHQPGNGLGLSIVAATCQVHDGALRLGDNHPGLKVSMVLPAADPASFPNDNVTDTVATGSFL